MAIKDILVHLEDSSRGDVRMAVAAMLAARHDAHLTGLTIIAPPSPGTLPGSYPGIPSFDLKDLAVQIRRDRIADTASIKQRFEHRLQLDNLRGEWRVVEGETNEIVALHGRYADLLIVGQQDPDFAALDGGSRLSIPALTACGRPLLVIPFAGHFDTFGKRVLVAWNATSEAALAVHESLPLLESAKEVTVLSINPKHGIRGDGDIPAADIAIHLARHGINVRAAHTIAHDIGEGEALLSYASDISADLLVAGMHGHSRLHGLVFGGVTYDFLSAMTLPTFLVP